MSGFSSWERSLARTLERVPFIRTIAKESYKRILYLKHRTPGFTCDIHPEISITTPYGHAGLSSITDEFFFGYYDKSPWSPDMRQMLFHRVEGNRVAVECIDYEFRQVRTLGISSTWNWQQGAMAQWLLGDPKLPVVYNTIIGGLLGCSVVEREDGKTRGFIPFPIQAVNPCENEALSINYRRLAALRPCYGYTIDTDNFKTGQALDVDGIWRINCTDGTAKLIVSLAELAQREPTHAMQGAAHKVNHCIYSPHGDRFVFLHRFIGRQGRYSRLYMARADGSNLRLLLDDRMVSHYHWDGNSHIIVWARTAKDGDRYYRVNVEDGSTIVLANDILDCFGDGHCSMSPCGRWMITDTYPDKGRIQHLILYDTKAICLTVIGRFYSPWRYRESLRCDLHPRWSPDGKYISIDSVHSGKRKVYLFDITKLIKES